MKTFIRSLSYALNGILIFIRDERNAKIHLIAAITAIGLSYFLQISPAEWIWVIMCIFIVIAAEAFNTAIEEICNFIHPQKEKRIKRIKDISAGAVLMISIMALIIACLIFIPKILYNSN